MANRSSEKGDAGEIRRRAKETRLLLQLLAQPQAINRASQSLMLFLGGIFYIGLLLINAVAVLSEDRFLARSACLFAVPHPHTCRHVLLLSRLQSDGRLLAHQTMSGFNKIMIKAVDMGTLRRTLA